MKKDELGREELQEELREELAEEARDEQEDIAANRAAKEEEHRTLVRHAGTEENASDDSGGEKLLETVELPTDEVNAALKEQESEEKILETVELPTDEVNAALEEQESEEKILETVELPTDEVNAALKEQESGEHSPAGAEPGEEKPAAAPESSGEKGASSGPDSSGNDAESGEKSGEKILETVELPTEEVRAALDGPAVPGEAGQGDNAASAGDKSAPKGKIKAFFTGIGRGFRRLKIWQRVLCIVLAVVVVLGLAGYGYFHSKYALMQYSTGEFHSDDDIASVESSQDEMENEELEKRQESEQIEERSAVEATGEVETSEGVVNILLIGTDDRTKTFSTNARGDTCILLSINRDRDEAHLVSFERATGVKVLSGQYEGQWDWLTHMFWYGGPAMMTEEIRENFKVDVTKYIRVNIYTLMELLDSIDGIDIELTQAEADNINHPGNTYTAGNEARAIKLGYPVQTDLVAGMNHLDAGTAVVYARLRAIDDDWHRVERQRKVILAAIDKLKKMNLAELDSLLNNVLPLVQTNLTESDVAGLLPEALTFVNMEYDSITFPLRHTYGLMDGMQGRRVLAVDFDTNAQELQNLLYGDTTAAELTAKYENAPAEYNYRDSSTYQENYQDAESVAGTVSGTEPFQEGTSGTASGTAGVDSETGTDAAAGQPDPSASSLTGTDGTAGSTAGTADGSSSDLGELEATSTDPETGVVTTTYYNTETGVRTSVAVHPSSGASTVSITDTNSGETTTVHTDVSGTTTTTTSETDTEGTASDTAATGTSVTGAASAAGTAGTASGGTSSGTSASGTATATETGTGTSGAASAASSQSTVTSGTADAAAQQAALAAQQAAAQQAALAAQQAAAQQAALAAQQAAAQQ